jgi:hypothetical protein
MPHRLAWLTGLAALALGIAIPAMAQDTPEFLAVTEDNRLRTLHTLPLEMQAPADLPFSGPTHRSATFNAVPFDISLGAFLDHSRAIMVHAERVADGSGAANYTRFPETDWLLSGFRDKPLQCLDLTADDVAVEHDLSWLRDHGFDPVGPIWLDQYFLSDDDFNNEVVISFIVRAEDCETEPAVALSALRRSFIVTDHRSQ